MTNLDLECMKFAQEIALPEKEPKKLEAITNKTMAVLAGDGPYAMMLFLDQGNEINIKLKLKSELWKLGTSIFTDLDGEFDYKKISNFAENLDDYLLLKMIWQRTLTYVRYHAKGLRKHDDMGTISNAKN